MRISDWSSDVCSSDLQDARQRCAYIVCNRIGHITHAVHQGFDAVQHVIDVMPKMCELIHVGRIGNTPRKLACSHMKRRIAYGFDAASQFAAKNECADERSEEHTSELQSLMRISYADFCLNTKIDSQ